MSLKEESLEKWAGEAINYAKDNNLELEDAAVKISQDYVLDRKDIENLCGRINHKYFSQKYAEDKLAVFNVVRYADVVSRVSGSMKKAAHVITITPEGTGIAKNAEEEIIDTENDQDGQEEILNAAERQKANYESAGVDNADILNMLTIKKDNIAESIYNQVRALKQSGSSFNEIYDVLRASWGEHNEEETRKTMRKIVDRMKTEGWVSGDEEFDESIPFQHEDEDVIDNDLTKAASELMSVNEELVKRYIAHEKIAHILQSYGAGDRAAYITNKLLDKEPYSPTRPDSSINKTASRITKTANIGEAITKGLGTGVALAGIGAAAYLGNEMIMAAKIPGVKKAILRRDPELQKVDPKRFNEVFYSLIELNPKLLDAPFALSSLVKKHVEYGVIDTPTIKDLLRSAPQSRFSKIEDNIMKSMTF
jgi:hypothetical protein